MGTRLYLAANRNSTYKYGQCMAPIAFIFVTSSNAAMVRRCGCEDLDPAVDRDVIDLDIAVD